jgi:hypoxanthine phosphoribosyltransferase
MRHRNVASVKTCSMLDKPSRRLTKVDVDYAGFEVPDEFVVGYGLDFAERYRNLPFVGVLHPHVYKLAFKKINPVRPRKSRRRKA